MEIEELGYIRKMKATIKPLTYLSGGHLFIVDPKNNEYAVLERLFPIKMPER